jgi:hypothetical protein
MPHFRDEPTDKPRFRAVTHDVTVDRVINVGPTADWLLRPGRCQRLG